MLCATHDIGLDRVVRHGVHRIIHSQLETRFENAANRTIHILFRAKPILNRLCQESERFKAAIEIQPVFD